MIRSMLSGFIDRTLAVTGVILFTQVPLFYQQYLQRLSGHLAELELQVTLLKQTAARSGKSLSAYIDKFLSHSDPDISLQGQFMQEMMHRLDQMGQAFSSLSEAPVWAHPLYLVRFGDAEIASSTLRHFEPGLAFNLESAAYGLIGMVLGLGLFKAVRWAFYAVLPKKKHAAALSNQPA